MEVVTELTGDAKTKIFKHSLIDKDFKAQFEVLTAEQMAKKEKVLQAAMKRQQTTMTSVDKSIQI